MFKEVLYLGPQGSYSEIAIKNFNEFLDKEPHIKPLNSISKIVQTLKNSDNTICAVIPIENSIEGIVRDTQDNLYDLALNGYRIYAETQLAITHSLIGFGKKSDLKFIKSHPQALAQCREYIYNNWKDEVELLPTLSTSNAVANLAGLDKTYAAIGSKHCAELYDIPIIETEINDKKNNTTRFILVSKQVPENNYNNKVSIVFSTENIPGALNKVLNILERHNLNMSYINSRPSRRELGEYIFYVDFTGHTQNANVTMALIEIQQNVKMFEILSEGAICV